MTKRNTERKLAAAVVASGLALWAQDPLRYSVPTPRPINPAESTTNPSAIATQRQNPYLGSVPEKATGATIELTLRAAIERGLRYNLGLVESNQASADVRAARLRALALLLPQISGRGRQGFENLSLREIGLRAIPGVGPLPPTTGNFAYQDARVALSQTVYDAQLRHEYRSQKEAEQASLLTAKDSRDVVVFAAGAAYMQAIASAARVETAKAQVASAAELDQQTASRVKSEVSPEIDSLRAQVERQAAGQRLADAENQLEKDKLTLGRIIGFGVDQKFALADSLSHRALAALTSASATEEALRTRADLASAEASLRSAESSLRAERAQRLPVVTFAADYGGGGSNLGNFNQLYSISGNVTVPLYTGGRIRADIEQARAELERRRAEYEDLKGRVAYDVRVAWLDVAASESSVQVAGRNKALAERALVESQDRYTNGVTNFLEVVQGREAVAIAEDNYTASLYSLDVAKIALARAMGSAETRIAELLGGK
ncbi:MAG: TolC family protein [Acidobacteriia bacterium]|nr:TolC family protein [Terriglobia bacterium]